jgi:hypothetical protein
MLLQRTGKALDSPMFLVASTNLSTLFCYALFYFIENSAANSAHIHSPLRRPADKNRIQMMVLPSPCLLSLPMGRCSAIPSVAPRFLCWEEPSAALKLVTLDSTVVLRSSTPFLPLLPANNTQQKLVQLLVLLRHHTLASSPIKTLPYWAASRQREKCNNQHRAHTEPITEPTEGEEHR